MGTGERAEGEKNLELRRDAEGLALVGDGMVLRADFVRLLPRLRPDRLGRELLVRAARVRGVEAASAVDATAGLGEDALLLAAAGFVVTMFEKDPVIAALLRDALERAARVPELAPVAERMTLVEGDSVAGLRCLGFSPDVVFLDPMFPERTKSAAVKKKFQLLHHLERPCDNEEELVEAALAARPRKVVIKRPPKGPLLAGARPSYQVSGKAVRYDVLVPPRD
ncbi:MAG TPA: class I SAM-dependent methyltransferase [Candidatus Olsenella avicola]|nr:class I SAM-dependent methyltransferase [Candidatus Olsenella avicola]